MNQKQKVGEKMELIEGRGTRENWKLPKNVRQMGEPGTGMKILIEDYVYTFLHQMAQNNLTCIKTAVLAGRVEENTAVYIRGAVEIDMGQDVHEWFSYEHWREIFQDLQNWFDGLEIVGWYMANPGFPPVLTEELKNLHMRNFSGNTHVFFQTDVLDKEEIFYLRGEKGFAPVNGFYIFYEKNDRMQEYMSRKKGGVGIEPDGMLKDRAAARFRNVMMEKREQNAQKKVFAFLYTSSMFLVLVILVIGVTLVNNYDRMSNMENALHQISESLGTEADSVEAAMEEENRLAQAEQSGEPEAPDEQDTEGELSGQEETSSEPQETPSEPEESAEEPEEGQAQPEEPAEEEQPEEPAEEQPEESAEEPEEMPSEQDGPSEDQEEVQEAVSEAVREPERYQVQAGDTILKISRARYGTDDMVKKICEVNELGDGNQIYVGEIILLP